MILVDTTAVVPTVAWNDTHTFVYFTYSHSTKTVGIKGTVAIPEFPSWPSMLLILSVLTVTVAIYKRRLLKTPLKQ